MKKLLLAASYVLLVACSQNTVEAHDHSDHEGHNHEEHSHEGHDHSEHEENKNHGSEVVLNDGAKWEANAETTEGIANMLSLIHEYDASAEPESYEDLQEQLQAQFRDIFKKCTMTGGAHNQLHNYLIPLKEKLEKISEDNLYDIESYLHTYGNYFE